MNWNVSIIVTAYNEEESIQELYSQIMMSISKCVQLSLMSEYEIWFVNDGSTDSTEEVINSLCENDSNVHLISFRKNMGKSIALNAAFHHVNKDGIIFTMDADLQDDAAEFEYFIKKINEGYDLVVGWKKTRHDPWEKRLPSKIFNFVTSKLSGVKLHDFDCGFKCFRKEVIDSLEIYGELHRYIPVLAYRNGFQIAEIEVKHHKRMYGKSKYGLERYLRGLLDSFTTIFLLKYFDRPMYLFGRIGIAFALLGGAICTALSIKWFLGSAIGGRPALILGVLFIVVGIQLIMTGLLGNLLVDISHGATYNEHYIKSIK